MTGTNATHDPDSVLAAWLDEGPRDLPDATRRAILTALPTTPQARLGHLAPRRFSTMSRLAALSAVGVVLVAGGFALLGGGRGPAAAPTPIPTTIPTSPPSPAVTVVDQSKNAGYTLTIPSSWHYSVSLGGISLSGPGPMSASIWVGRFASTETGYVIQVGQDLGSIVRGRTAQELIGSVDENWLTNGHIPATAEQPITIDGSPAVVTEHLRAGVDPVIDALVIRGDYAYDIQFSGPRQPVNAFRAAFEAFVAGLHWSS